MDHVVFNSNLQLLAKDAEPDEVYGDFEDLETGKVVKGSDKTAPDGGADGPASEGQHAQADGSSSQNDSKEKSTHDRRLAKKERMKAVFNASYDGGKTYYDEVKDAMAEQMQFNRSEFEDDDDSMRVQFEGFRPGAYVRIEISHVPYEMVEYFNPKFPVIVGGLLASESDVGYIQLRFKKHRWHKKILKTRNPLILSIGWRRFETVPLYAMEDHNGRNRLLKYTPEHMHCVALVYGTIFVSTLSFNP